MRIILTGGGSAGHVTPNIALIPLFLEGGWKVDYIGGVDGMERGLIGPLDGVTYYGVSTGKLRRYFDVKNFTDPFRVLKGIGQAAGLMRKLCPDVVFAKGGFVSVPVVYAARMNGIPVVLHESDMTPGLSNKLCAPMARAVCTSFPETAGSIRRGVYTGTPLRKELFEGDAKRARHKYALEQGKPVLMITGGSQGAAAVNEALRAALPLLLDKFEVFHLCGKEKTDPSIVKKGYVQVEYISEGMNDIYAAADIVISRAGSNTICELLALKKPHLLIPYPKSGTSRGDQVDNALSFKQRGFSHVLMQEDMTGETLSEAVMRVWNDKEAVIRAMQSEPAANGAKAVYEQIIKTAKKGK